MAKASNGDGHWATIFWAVAPIAFATVGCGADLGTEPAGAGGGGPGEVIAVEPSAVTSCTPSLYGVNGSVTGPAEDHICFATGIYSTSQAMKPFEPELFIQHRSNQWSATGSGEMSCVPMSCFHSGSADQYLLSGMFQTTVTATLTSGRVEKTADMWLGDSMAFMSMYQYGNPWMVSEWAALGTNTDPSQLNYLDAVAYGPFGTSIATTLSVLGYSFFVGKPHSGHVVPQMSYSGTSGGDITMIPTNSGICSFSFVQIGTVTGTVHIYSKNSFWHMSTTAASNANAICYLFDQTQ